jgi:hypothetical protein
MGIITHIISNGAFLFIPIFAWNIIFTRYLPPAYEAKSFDVNVSRFILIGEGIFRTIIFGMPLFMKLNFTNHSGRVGLWLFLCGVCIYFLSWILLILFPGSSYGKSLLGFTAPAYTIIIWLIGFALIADSYYVNIAYSKWHFIVPSIIMTCFHFAHSLIAYGRDYPGVRLDLKIMK